MASFISKYHTFKGTRYTSRFGGFKTDITHDRVLGHIKKIVGDHPFCFKEVGRAGAGFSFFLSFFLSFKLV